MTKLGAKRIETSARDPFQKKRTTYFGLTTDNSTAIIEMANASGLRLLGNSRPDPLHASSCGTGDLILAALDKKPRRILLGMGGSATVDGGAGILTALGVRFLDTHGNELTNLPAGLTGLASIDITRLDPRLDVTELTILTDVENLLLGANGAAAVFGPQKGADPEGVQQLEAALHRLSAIISRQWDKDISLTPSGGAAGGAAAGLYGLLGARLVNGIDYFLEITQFDQALEQADLVITGEGSIDKQTLQGKGPFGVANRAKKNGLPVIGLAGRLQQEKDPELDQYFDALLPINHELLPLPEALAHTAANLTATARAIGNLLCTRGSL